MSDFKFEDDDIYVEPLWKSILTGFAAIAVGAAFCFFLMLISVR